MVRQVHPHVWKVAAIGFVALMAGANAYGMTYPTRKANVLGWFYIYMIVVTVLVWVYREKEPSTEEITEPAAEPDPAGLVIELPDPVDVGMITEFTTVVELPVPVDVGRVVDPTEAYLKWRKEQEPLTVEEEFLIVELSDWRDDDE